MESDYLKGILEEKKADYLQTKREYIAVLGKLVVKKAGVAEIEQQIKQIEEPIEPTEEVGGAWHQTQL